MRGIEVAVDAPRDRLTDRPAPGTLAIEPELARQSIEPIEHGPPAVAELERADNRRDRELALADKRLRIDHEPRLALRSEDVVRMKILVQEHLLALARSELLERRDRRLDQALIERLPDPLPLAADRARPPRGLVRQGPERRPRRLPQARQELDEDLERVSPEWSTRPAALEKERVALIVPGEQSHGSVALPVLEGLRLVIALVMGPPDLQDDVPGGDDVRREPAGERLLDLESPLPGALLDEPREMRLPGLPV